MYSNLGTYGQKLKYSITIKLAHNFPLSNRVVAFRFRMNLMKRMKKIKVQFLIAVGFRPFHRVDVS